MKGRFGGSNQALKWSQHQIDKDTENQKIYYIEWTEVCQQISQ